MYMPVLKTSLYAAISTFGGECVLNADSDMYTIS